jgi:hypothetical protein
MYTPNGYNTVPHDLYLEQLAAASNAVGNNYYVDANYGSNSNDGLSWDKCFKTLTYAMAVSHANIAAGASGWANRNRIFYKGDNDEASAETLITLAQKTDIIGVGSYDHNPFPILIGNHVIGAGAFMGCRFINMGLQSLAAGGVILTLPTTVSGFELLNSFVIGSSAVVATKGILATASEMLKIKGTRFIGKFSNAAIEIGAGASNGLLIEGNHIESAAKGIEISGTMTCALRGGFIKDNYFDVGTFAVNDNAGNKVAVSGSRGRTASNGSIDETLVCSAALSNNNILTCSAGTQSIYPPIAAIPA